jgi:hypothetical protein
MTEKDKENRKWTGEPFVMVPCRLIDEVMPDLKDTELRLLLVVLRQTVGRRNPDGTPKERDWLSHSQLKARTGRASEAVSDAVAALVRRGLIAVRSEEGRLLPDPAERQRVRGRLYYAVGSALEPSLRMKTPSRAVGSTGKAKTTGDDTSLHCRRFRKSGALPEDVSAVPTVSADGRIAVFLPGQKERLERERIEQEKNRIRERLTRLTQRNR